MASNLENNIPLADDDSTEEITDVDILKLSLGSGNKARAVAAASAVQAQVTGGGLNPSNAMSSTESIPGGGGSAGLSTTSSSPAQPSSLDIDVNPDEVEEKERLISQVLELQNTLDDLSQRVDSVKEENLKLKSENQVLGQYIENLMSASSVFQSTSPKVSSKTGPSSSPPPPSTNNNTTNNAAAVSPATTNNKSPAGSTNSVRV